MQTAGHIWPGGQLLKQSPRSVEQSSPEAQSFEDVQLLQAILVHAGPFAVHVQVLHPSGAR
jgi:hypothetical protein